jgi:hypothetical protein
MRLSNHTSLFKAHYEELRLTQPGWYPDGVEPPLMTPSPSTEWVKQKKSFYLRCEALTTPNLAENMSETTLI